MCQLMNVCTRMPDCADLRPSLRVVQTGRSSARYSREIVYTRKEGWYFSSSEEPPNNLLQQVRPPTIGFRLKTPAVVLHL